MLLPSHYSIAANSRTIALMVMIVGKVNEKARHMAGLLVLQIVEFVSNEVFTLAAFDSMTERLHDSTVSTTAVRSATPEVEPTTLAAFYSATHIDSPKVTRASQSVVKITS